MKPYTLPYHLFSYGGENKLQFLNGQDKQYSKATFFDDKVLVMEKYFVGLYEKEYQTSQRFCGIQLYSCACILEYAMYGLQEAGGNKVGFYSGGAHQKVGVYSHKMLFYTLGMK